MSIDAELFELARLVQAYDLRLRLVSPGDRRHLQFRREIEKRRDAAAAKLAKAEAARGWINDEPPAA